MPPKKALPVSASGAVAALRSEVQEYHLEVTNAITLIQANCKHCREQIQGIDLQINGEKPERDGSPSMKSDINSLKQSRSSVRRGMGYAWTAIATICGALIGLVAKALN